MGSGSWTLFWLHLGQLSAVGLAPYHYGGWLFDFLCALFYSPPVFTYPGMEVFREAFPWPVNPPRVIYHPVTAVFVRQGVKSGIVPMHR